MTQSEQQFELLISEVIDRKYGICDDFVDESLLKRLIENLHTYNAHGDMHPAGIGRHFDFKKNLEVRGDVIRWIEEDTVDPYEIQLLEKINQLVHYLNKTCYTQINEFEFHYAFYEAGSFYKRHLDQFKSHRGRKFSLVIYLNDDWQVSDGGNLRLYLENDLVNDVFPEGGRAVFFRSDEVEHEVMASSHRPRMSIAGWLKSV